jgi:hypothetical protein
MLDALRRYTVVHGQEVMAMQHLLQRNVCLVLVTLLLM